MSPVYWASATGTQGVRRMPVGAEIGKAGGGRVVGGLQFYLQESELSLVGKGAIKGLWAGQ